MAAPAPPPSVSPPSPLRDAPPTSLSSRPPPLSSSALPLASSLPLPASLPLPSSPSSEVLEVCIQQLNEEFPTLESLASLDAKIASLQSYLRALDQDILTAVREQARRSSSSSSELSLEAFRASVKTLMSTFQLMQSRAEASGRKVEKICADLQRLAQAKKNLTLSISTLKKLVMVVAALGKLRVAGKTRKYAEASQLLLAINNLVGAFEPYRDRVPRVNMLLSEKDLLCRSLQQQLIEDYQAVFDEDASALSFARLRGDATNPFAPSGETAALDGGPGPAFTLPFLHDEAESAFLDPAQREALKDAPLAVEALGPTVVRDVVQLVCHSLLFNYNKLFRPAATAIRGENPFLDRPSGDRDASGLEVIDRRFAWLKRTMREFEGKHEALFPPRWRVKMHLAALFCRVTKQHLVDLLSCAQHTVDPILLVRLLHKTVEFELSLDAKFRNEERALEMMKDLDDRQTSLPSSAASLQYYDHIFPQKQSSSSYNPFEAELRAAGEGGRDGEMREEEAARVEAFQLKSFRGCLSSVFDPFLFRWAEFEEQQLVDVFSAALVADKVVSHASFSPTALSALLATDEAGEADTEARAREQSSEEEEDDFGEDESHVCVFGSASEILSACKKLFDKAKAVSRGQAIKEVAGVFKHLFKKYASVLQSRLPPAKQFASPPGLSDVSVLFSGSAEASSALSASGLSSCSVAAASPFLLVCAAVGTSVYVETSLGQICENLSKALVDAAGQEEPAAPGGADAAFRRGSGDSGEAEAVGDFQFDEEKDLLWNIQAACVGLLVSSFSGVIASSLAHIQSEKLKSLSLNERREQRPHPNVVALRRSLRDSMTVASLFLTASLCRFVWDKLAQAVITKFHAALDQIKALTPVAAQALLRDAESLHAALLELPGRTFGCGEGSQLGNKKRKQTLTMPAGYEKYVSREMERAEAALRVAAYPPEDGVAPAPFSASSLVGRSSASTAKVEKTLVLPMKEAKLFSSASPIQPSLSS
uniref:Vps53 family, N-terminal protein n=1 Tax=Neospora caninum (strain Liverpool) TaxID=572307 RepID=A0A0F7U6L1_NEOCL|nr:TPA: Vps53 family, N-terminal protein [Neospora caninum Liverpool]